MKRFFFGFAALSVLANPVLAQTTLMQSESNLRCSVPSDVAVYSREPGGFSAISSVAPRVVAALGAHHAPDLVVDGWAPKRAPLSTVLAQLGSEAGFAVTGTTGYGPVEWTGGSAPLSRVLDNLTGQVGAIWSFSAGVVTVSKKAIPSSTVDAVASLPTQRDLVLAVTDALRGYGAHDLKPSPGSIAFTASATDVQRIQSGFSAVTEVNAFDVSFMEGRPSSGRYSWSQLSPSALMADGAGGRFLMSDNPSAIEAFIRSSGDFRGGGMQTVAGPAGWALVVPQAQCGTGSLEVTVKPRRVTDGFGLAVNGSGFSYDAPLVPFGQTLVLASREPVNGWIRIITIRPRVVAVK